MLSQELRKISQIKCDSESIHVRAVRAAESFRSNQMELICALQLVDEHKVYRRAGCPSLYKYALMILRLSEHQAYEFITVARAARHYDKLQTALEKGHLTV